MLSDYFQIKSYNDSLLIIQKDFYEISFNENLVNKITELPVLDKNGNVKNGLAYFKSVR